MNKNWYITLVVLLILLIGGLTGYYIYKLNKTSNLENMEETELAKQEVKQENFINNEISSIETSQKEVKISPNAKVIQKIYYNYCDHMTREEENVKEEYVNETEEEFQKEYPDWKIENFSENEITVYKEEEGMCKKHYKIKDTNGILTVYTLNEKGEETLKEVTGVVTQYLPETDFALVQDGIEAIGDEQLYSILEDFE